MGHETSCWRTHTHTQTIPSHFSLHSAETCTSCMVCVRTFTYLYGIVVIFVRFLFFFSHPITPFPNHIHTPTVLFTHQCIQPPPYQHNLQDLLYPTMQFNVLEDEEQSETTIYLPVTSWEDPVCVCLCASVCFKEGVGCSNAS